MGKGDSFENWLCDVARDTYDYAELRSPGSGTKDVAYPDVVLLKPIYSHDYGVYEKYKRHKVKAFELKSNSDGTAYFDKHEIVELEEWSKRAGGDAYIGVKPDLRLKEHTQRYFIPIEDLHETEKGYSVRKQDWQDALSLEDVLE